ncbi:hypothetical protein ABZX12_40965 [Kribbella sp. NPDC003505]|uniref:hypothetical protein n=1 Tax=Kribbella sp. NPDC003505 TaxID=3154448 RepID=UPI0033A8A4E5
MSGQEHEAARERQLRAIATLDRVFGMSAPVAELLDAARQGIEEIDRLSETAESPSEEMELLDMSEPLEQLVEELEAMVGEVS